jgi:hypothetical protein
MRSLKGSNVVEKEYDMWVKTNKTPKVMITAINHKEEKFYDVDCPYDIVEKILGGSYKLGLKAIFSYESADDICYETNSDWGYWKVSYTLYNVDLIFRKGAISFQTLKKPNPEKISVSWHSSYHWPRSNDSLCEIRINGSYIHLRIDFKNYE